MSKVQLRNNDTCPCGSKINALDCCLVFINGQRLADNAELLMRSRYTAYVLDNEKYILKTWHSSQRPSKLGQDASLEWHGLRVLKSSPGKNNEAFVEFIAGFSNEGKKGQMHERSRFIREKGVWFYVDGEQVESNTQRNLKMPGRNEVCYCGSGKKFKKCCAVK
ncbi:MAG: YchJ family metal-binding protein [Gammaproteobacteria bacterium]|nr:YchJ family metal-binding protein [Gammaproteobacteria bacterium]